MRATNAPFPPTRRSGRSHASAVIAGIAITILLGAQAHAQVRHKKPDRGVYEPPRVGADTTAPQDADATAPQDDAVATAVKKAESGLAEMLRTNEPERKKEVAPPPVEVRPDATQWADKDRRLPLINVSVETSDGKPANRPAVNRPAVQAKPTAVAAPHKVVQASRLSQAGQTNTTAPKLQRVSNEEEVMLIRPGSPRIIQRAAANELEPPVRLLPSPPTAQQVDHHIVQGGVDVIHSDDVILHDIGCDGCPDCASGCDAIGCDAIGCDGIGCDSMGCDSMGGCGTPWFRRWANSSLSYRPERWFGNAELLLLWRRGDLPPILVTTGPDTDPNTAGELGQVDTEVVFPTQVLLRDMTAGGRVTLGTWLDGRQCRSLVLRGWLAGEENSRFSVDQTTLPVIARPFFNVTDNQVAAQDTQLVAFPNRADGSISIRASSDVYGGDVSVRQFWYGNLGATVDVLYGYQYMRLDEDLRISNSSVSLDDDFAPVDSILAIDDSFDVENEFHGGQFGLAARYRECCWSFNALAKVAFGQLRRTSTLSGSTFTRVDNAEATDANGLLVRSTNAGTFTDHTFGWIPEIDLTIGWQRWQHWEATFGYNIIAMTDAVRVSGVIDPELAVNLAGPPQQQQRPQVSRRDHTFYLQGIHFGMQYVY